MKTDVSERKSSWQQNPDAVRSDILQVAIEVFAEHGYAGARMEEIVRRTKTSKRMIYYYFGDKAGLYTRVLELASARLREGEDALQLGSLPPMDALATLAAFTFDYHRDNPAYTRLIAFENIHQGRHLTASKMIPQLNARIIWRLEDICLRGIEAGVFRPDVDPVELHWTISALCVFNISNRATFSHVHGEDLFTDAGQARLKARVVSLACDFARAR